MTKTRISLIVAALLLASTAHAKDPDFASIFGTRDGCFELYDLKANKLVTRYNPRLCSKRISPCSTFKVPLALMAFDAGILRDETTSMNWDGINRPRPEWNRDQTAATWMENSVVWFSQRLTPQIGMPRLKSYLSKFRYGNQNMSGGITKAWLQSSLLISPDEQLRFWQQFWREELPVSKHAYRMTKKITTIDTSNAGWVLNGKTGSGATGGGGKPILGLGWFVGHIARGEREYVFVTCFSDREEPAEIGPSGPVAREISKKILAEMDLY
jgi:beta-lactamase class D